MRNLPAKYAFAFILSFFFHFRTAYAFYEPVITTLGVEQGLSNNSVRCIYQDQKGFMWFGTFDGINRYDGYGFRVYHNNLHDSNSLVNNLINAINEDRQGNLWIGTRQGVSIYNQLADRFSTLTYFSGNDRTSSRVNDVIKDIKTDSRNNVLVGAENLGLLFCKNGESVATQVSLQLEGAMTTVFGVQAIKTAGDKAWVFVQNKGLCLLDYASLTLRLVNSAVTSASCLEMNGDELWIGTANGVYRYQTIANTCSRAFDTQDGSLTSNLVVALAQDKDHNLWIGTNGGGVNIWNRLSGKMEHLQTGDTKYSLSSGAVFAIYIDKQSRKWIGTLRGGINIIDPEKKSFQVITDEPGNKNGFTGKYISTFFETPDSNLWIGTEDAGLNFWDRKKNTFINYRHQPGNPASLPSNVVTTVSGDDRNNLWIVTFATGITRFQPAGQNFKHYQCINPVTGLENKVVYVLYQDREKTLWATTLRSGNQYGALYYYNRATDRFEVFDTNLSDLFTLNEDKEGILWGGNLNHLVRIDKNKATKKHRFYPIGHPVRAICEDKDGNFWVGTEGGGLVLFDRKQSRLAVRHTTEEGLCNNTVLNILEDRQGNLWMSTFNGLSRLETSRKTFKNYYQNDGLQSNQFNYNAALTLRSGELAFGGIKGFSIFHPKNITAAGSVPRVVITSIKVDGRQLHLNGPYRVKTASDEIREIRVPYNQAILSFDFTALEYSAPENISYAYYLEGWDRKWNYTGKLRTANYTHLSEGTYTFLVKSTDAEGQWNTKETGFTIIVLPPWYRTWWAYAIYMLLAGGAIFMYQRYRAYQTRLKYEVVLANIKAEKQRAEYQKGQAELEMERAEKEKGLAELEKERAEREKREAELALEKAEKEKGQAELSVERAELEKERAEKARMQAESEIERVKSEKEREINEKRHSFFTHVSHEFRTPLTLIINPIKDLLQKRKEIGKAPEGELPVVYRNARRLLSLVDELLLFRKAESGADKVRPVRLDVCSVGKEAYLCFVQQAQSKHITYHFECNPESLEIYADPQKLEIILFNLLSNALKYTGPGGSILLRIRETQQSVEIVVDDTGVGVPKEAGDRLFEKFYQPDRKDAQAKPGIGIGLFLVKQFTEQHKGEISYHSEEGKGTTFTLKLQKGKDHFGPDVFIREGTAESVFLQGLKEGTDLEGFAGTEEKTNPIQEVVTEKQSMLIVDDDEQMRQYLALVFKGNYLVQLAGTGEEGLKLAQKLLPDLIISDVNMEAMSGIELCRIIKEDPALGHIPIILLSSSASDEAKLQGVEGGADDYIMKPFDKNLLIARVFNLLKSRNSLQKYFYNEITLNKSSLKISTEYKEFLEKCIAVVESHLEDENFSVKTLLSEMGMSHSNLFRKVKSVSGQSVNVFIRFIRLRKAAELFINTDNNVNETAFMVGIRDTRYFREQFHKLFGMNPSEYIRKYRKAYGKQYTVNKDSINPEDPAGRDNM